MKYATIIKTGYTARSYGCSGEYFTAIYTAKNASNGLFSFKFEGLYGVEDRIAHLFKDNGYKLSYTNANYGKLTRKDIYHVYGENEVIKNFKELLQHQYIEDVKGN